MINCPNCYSHNSPLISFNQTAHVQGHGKCSVILIMATKITRYNVMISLMSLFRAYATYNTNIV